MRTERINPGDILYDLDLVTSDILGYELVQVERILLGCGKIFCFDPPPSVYTSNPRPLEAIEVNDRYKVLWRQNEKAQKWVAIIDKAEKMMTKISLEERSPLSDAVEKLKKVLTNDDTDQIDIAGDELVDLLFDLEF